MNGMHYQWAWAWDPAGDGYTASYEFSTAPLSTILELSLDNYFEFDSEALVELDFTHIEFLDSNGVTREQDLPDPDFTYAIPAISVTGLTDAQWELKIQSCAVQFTMNAYFWNQVF
jgi:hypothetical protein